MSVCNIGSAERRARRRSGLFGIAVAALLAVALAGSPDPLGAIVALPLFGGLLGLAQARAGLCVAYALAGVENLDAERLGETRRVEDAARRAARIRALRIALAPALITVTLTSLYLVAA
jgi:hypothetical protein